MTIGLLNKLSDLKGVGPRTQKLLEKLGITQVRDLIFHLPLRYEDRTRIVPLNHICPGQQVVVEGTVELTEIQYRGRRSLLCRMSDHGGFLTLRFFHFNQAQQRGLAPGVRLRCFGEVRYGYYGYEMVHPEYRRIDVSNPPPVEQCFMPVYPTTEGLSQFTLRKLMDQVFEQHNGLDFEELLPQEILGPFRFPDLKDALLFLHHPPADASVELLITGQHPYQKRLAFEELLAHHLSLRQLRERTQKLPAVSLSVENEPIFSFMERLPFMLTQAQERVFEEIQRDLNRSSPMLRLVQGDVGCGKTVVAALVALIVARNRRQVVMMAPTELLSEQHLKNFQHWFEPLGVQVVELTGRLKGKLRQNHLEQIASGQAQIVIGTHALFQEGVEFNDLALVMIDEQHRFGVHQRLSLREKGVKTGYYPHQLIMTATPIPRTLAMAMYADLDLSIIDELPPGRIPIKTVVMNNRRRLEVIEHIKSVCAKGQQIYWICTLIEESEVLQCQTALSTQARLQALLPKLRVGLVHGQMKSRESDQIMLEFKAGHYDILVATTVIEVGIDVQNANLMVIENPERLGLSQLHQLRGRVGRGKVESYCVLLYQSPLSWMAKKRLEMMRSCQDGFVIAQKDLELRGPGEVLGTRQTGLISMRIADLVRDQSLLPSIEQAASIILRKYPQKVAALIDRWIHSAGQYGNV
jgi:ATP-dependent DNA helicase RecG